MIYNLFVELEIAHDKQGNIEDITILGERPDLGIDLFIANEIWNIKDAIKREIDEDELQKNITHQENKFERLDEMYNK